MKDFLARVKESLIFTIKVLVVAALLVVGFAIAVAYTKWSMDMLGEMFGLLAFSGVVAAEVVVFFIFLSDVDFVYALEQGIIFAIPVVIGLTVINLAAHFLGHQPIFFGIYVVFLIFLTHFQMND